LNVQLGIRSSNGQEQTLCTTHEHPVYANGLGWVESMDLKVGDEIPEPSGGVSTVIATRQERHAEGIAVYNFRVVQAHTYFVREANSTAEPVWVHNANYDEFDPQMSRQMQLDDMADWEATDGEFYGGDGVIYEVPGEGTPSGRPYIGSADDLDARAATATDLRDRDIAQVVGRYPIGDDQARRLAELAAMDDRGGIANLDNKRREIAH